MPKNVPPEVAAVTLAVQDVIRRRAEVLADKYRLDPTGYIHDKMGWDPWSGDDKHPGQQEVIDAYTLALAQQLERREYDAERITEDKLKVWHPGEIIKNRIRVPAGHNVGKTKLTSGLVNHFFDCCRPSIIYTFAPTSEQVHDLLWKEIKGDRRDKGLPGRILDLRLDNGDKHFAIGRATNNAHGMGTERAQGQHGEYLMFVLDEAEGVADFVYDAIESMTSGGISIVFYLANPRTDNSRFHDTQYRADVANFTISCLWHPNVVADKEVVPNAVKRTYVTDMVSEHCTVVAEHDPAANTFELPWEQGEEKKIYRPDGEFMFRVLGEPPAGTAENIFISRGVYQSAKNREEPLVADALIAYMGVDVARYGSDFGTLYVRNAGVVERFAQFSKQDTSEYWRVIHDCCVALVKRGIHTIDIRVDGGGGFGGGVIDQLEHDFLLQSIVPRLIVREIHFNGIPYSWKAYGDLVTEMYANAAESLLGLKLINVPNSLEEDLTKRQFKWMNYKGINIRVLEPKDDFRKRLQRSPDDGDGFILCTAPSFIFDRNNNDRLVAETPMEIGPQFGNFINQIYDDGIGPQF